jgi:hypothetical protein
MCCRGQSNNGNPFWKGINYVGNVGDHVKSNPALCRKVNVHPQIVMMWNTCCIQFLVRSIIATGESNQNMSYQRRINMTQE